MKRVEKQAFDIRSLARAVKVLSLLTGHDKIIDQFIKNIDTARKESPTVVKKLKDGWFVGFSDSNTKRPYIIWRGRDGDKDEAGMFVNGESVYIRRFGSVEAAEKAWKKWWYNPSRG